MARIEMRDQYEGHAGIGRGMAEELLEGLQATGGSAQADNGKVVALSRLVFRGSRWGFSLGHCGMLCSRGTAASRWLL
ncbi:MAG: hypothetical protein Q7U66_00110 [Methylobacter sp.]|nr:hypothetical protein [Methylobacter sp.]